jgi:hypothetical protein
VKNLYQIPKGKGIFTKEEFLEMVRVVGGEMKREKESEGLQL